MWGNAIDQRAGVEKYFFPSPSAWYCSLFMDTSLHDTCSSTVDPLSFFNLIQAPVTLPLPSPGSVLRAVMTSPGAIYLRDPQVCLCMWAKSIQLCPTLCKPTDGSPTGPSVHGTPQAKILEWVAMPSSKDIPSPGIEPKSLMSPTLAGKFFTTNATISYAYRLP